MRAGAAHARNLSFVGELERSALSAALCLEIDGRIASFIAFTSSEGSIFISLMGTHSDYHRKGYGSIPMENLFDIVKVLGFNRVFALTVPPNIKHRTSKRLTSTQSMASSLKKSIMNYGKVAQSNLQSK